MRGTPEASCASAWRRQRVAPPPTPAGSSPELLCAGQVRSELRSSAGTSEQRAPPGGHLKIFRDATRVWEGGGFFDSILHLKHLLSHCCGLGSGVCVGRYKDNVSPTKAFIA